MDTPSDTNKEVTRLGRKIWVAVILSFTVPVKVVRRISMLLVRNAFKSAGQNLIFSPFDSFSYQTIEVGDNVFIGKGATFSAKCGIIIGNEVLFGPNVTIMGGNHVIDVPGKFIRQIEDKRPEDDATIHIEDDVWIGSNAIILKGAHLHRGCVVGAGSLVNSIIPPYSIAVGIPARVIRLRFDVETILKHEVTLYAPNARYTRDELMEALADYLPSQS